MKDKKPVISVVEHPDNSVLIQIKERKRDPRGHLVVKHSHSITVHRSTPGEVYNLILKTLGGQAA